MLYEVELLPKNSYAGWLLQPSLQLQLTIVHNRQKIIVWGVGMSVWQSV